MGGRLRWMGLLALSVSLVAAGCPPRPPAPAPGPAAPTPAPSGPPANTVAAPVATPPAPPPPPAPIGLGHGYDLLYSSRHYDVHGHTHFQVRRLDMLTRRSVELTHAASDCEYPVASPQGGWIAYARDKRVWVMAADGQQPRLVPTPPDWSFVTVDDWLPRGRGLLLGVASPVRTCCAPFLLDPLAPHPRELVDADSGSPPAPTEDLTVSSSCCAPEASGLSVQDFSGTERWSCEGSSGDWSPRGDRIVVTPDVVPPDPGDVVVRRSSDGAEFARYPLRKDSVLESGWYVCDWAPTAELVIVGGRGGDSTAHFQRYYLLNLRTGHQSLLGEGNDARWSPDSRYVAYVTARQTDPIDKQRLVWTSRLVLYDVATGHRRAITEGLQYNQQPSWIPRSR